MCNVSTTWKKVVLISDKADIRARENIRDKKGHYLRRKGQFSKNMYISLVHMHQIIASGYLK